MRVLVPSVAPKNANAAFIVYKCTNIMNGKFYIGVTKNGLYRRSKNHLYDAKRGCTICKIFHSAIRKYGEDNFIWQVIDTAKSFEDMMQKEVFWIKELKPKYNICYGGRGAPGAMLGKTHSDETKLRLRELGFAGLERFKQYQHLGPKAQMKQVVCLNTGKVYSCVGEAAKDTGADRAAITEVCLRYERRLTAKNLVFRYLGDHQGGKAEASKILEGRNKTWRCKRAVICISDGLRFPTTLIAAKHYDIFEESVRNSCDLGYLVGKNKIKFRFEDKEEVIRKKDTEEGRKIRREQAYRACLIAAEKAKQKRESTAAVLNG